MTHPTGDTAAAIAQLYDHYQRPILAHLIRLLGHRETAEDLCQETFVKAMRGWPQCDPPANVSAWLYRIATNTAYDHLRRQRRIRFTPLEGAEGAPGAVGPLDSRLDEREPVQRALERLPQRYQTTLVLHACAGHTTREIAAALGCTDNAVKTRLFRARARFRKEYQE